VMTGVINPTSINGRELTTTTTGDVVNVIIKRFWVDAEFAANFAHGITGEQKAHQVFLKLQLFIGARPFIDKSALARFTTVTLTIATVTECVIEVFMSVDRESEVVTRVVATSR
ncbi:hypothetical protein OFN94_26115, partial [Escherichia coli]|nr:hypothetical protein [Escherichia coli]